MLHHVQQAKTVENGPVRLVPRVQMADSLLSSQGNGHYSTAVVARRVVGERPLVRHPGLEPARAHSPGCWILDRGEPARVVSARSPPTRAILDVCVEFVPAAKQPQRNGVRRPPLIDSRGVEEGNEDMELPTLAEERAGGGERIGKRLLLDFEGVICRLGGRGDESADLPGLAAGVCSWAVSEVLADGSLRWGRGTIVAAFPARVFVEPFRSLLSRRPTCQAASQKCRHPELR